MVTDSRSFLSYPRHEYFRRLLCNIVGKDAEKGVIPADRELLAGLVRDVCFANAKAYIPLELGETGR
jgi:glucuronate isomerase